MQDNHTPSDDEGLREEIVEGVNQLCNIFEASILGAEMTDAQYQESCANYVDGLMALISQKIKDARIDELTNALDEHSPFGEEQQDISVEYAKWRIEKLQSSLTTKQDVKETKS